MPGRCYSCATSFGVFKKELGCKNCGFAFCKDCLTKKAPVPKRDNEKHKVCNKCYDILTGKAQAKDTARYSPPAAYVKRMAALEQRQNQPANTSSGSADTAGPSKQKVNAAKYKGMSKADIEIAERLEALKESQKQGQPPVPSQKEMETRLAKLRDDGQPPPPSSDEMSDRLAKLKGVNPTTANKPHVFQSDRRPEQQQIDDLLDEIADEVSIDNYGACGTTTESELENNLNKVSNDPEKAYNKNIPVPHQEPQGDVEKDDSELDMKEVQRLMESVAKEMELDAQRAMQGLQKDKELMDRLQKLKQKDKNENPAKPDGTSKTEDGTTATTAIVGGGAIAVEDSDDENDEEAIKRIIKQHLEEVRLDDEVDEAEITGVSKTDAKNSKKRKVKNTDDSPEYESDPDEFPWCCICNEDATLRCYDCDGDLYCRRCFREGHDKLDLQDHRTAPYKQKK